VILDTAHENRAITPLITSSDVTLKKTTIRKVIEETSNTISIAIFEADLKIVFIVVGEKNKSYSLSRFVFMIQ